jgi:hypothetical protein
MANAQLTEAIRVQIHGCPATEIRLKAGKQTLAKITRRSIDDPWGGNVLSRLCGSKTELMALSVLGLQERGYTLAVGPRAADGLCAFRVIKDDVEVAQCRSTWNRLTVEVLSPLLLGDLLAAGMQKAREIGARR